MPAAIIGVLIANSAAVIGVLGATGAAIAGAAASFIISSAQANRAQKKNEAAARNAYNAQLQDRTTTVRTPIQPRNIILGTDRTSGPLWPWFTWGGKRQFHTFGVILAGHECDGVVSHRFNADTLTVDANGWVTTEKYCRTEVVPFNESITFDGAGNATVTKLPVGVTGKSATVSVSLNGEDAVYPLEFSGTTVSFPPGAGLAAIARYSYSVKTPLFRIVTYLGGPAQTASPELIAAAAAAGVPDAWDSSRRGTQVCYSVIQMEADYNVLGQIGVPNYSVVLRGVKAFDTRTGLTTWTTNPAALSRWFMVDSIYSPKTLSSEVGTTELNASANVCDEAVAFSATRTEARYVCNGLLTSQATPLENFNHILDAMDGDAVWVGGAWQVMAGYYQTPTLTINEAVLSDAAITIAPTTPKDKLWNLVTGTFVDAAKDYARTSYQAVTSATYQTQDGSQVLPQQMDFELVNDDVRCQMIAWQRLARARQQLTVQLGTNLKGYDTYPLKNVALDLAEFGFSNQSFNVRSRTLSGPTLVYVLQKISSACYAWNYTQAGAAVVTPNTSLPDAVSVPTLLNFQASSGTAALLRMGATVFSRIYVTWNAVTTQYVTNNGKIDVQYRKVGTVDWLNAPTATGDATSLYISDVEDGATYELRGRCINNIGRGGTYTPLFHKVIGKQAPPSAPTNVTLTQSFVYFKGITDADLDGYAIRSIPGLVANWGQGTPLHDGLVKTIPYPLARRLYGLNTIMVVAQDTTGNISSVASASLDYGQPSASNVAQSYDFKAAGFPGTFTNCSVVSGNLMADTDPASNLYALADVYAQSDVYATQYLAMTYVSAPFVPRYGGGAMTLLNTLAGNGALIEFQYDGSNTNDIYSLADVYAATDLYGASSNFQPWTGALDIGRMQGIILRITIAGGTTQGVISALTANLALQELAQSFTAFTVAAGGSRLTPSSGTPALNFVTIRDVQMTAVVDGSGAMFGRQLDYSPALGSLVQGLDQTFSAVTGKFNISQKGLVDV